MTTTEIYLMEQKTQRYRRKKKKKIKFGGLFFILFYFQIDKCLWLEDDLCRGTSKGFAITLVWIKSFCSLRYWKVDCFMFVWNAKLFISTKSRSYQMLNKAFLSYRFCWKIFWKQPNRTTRIKLYWTSPLDSCRDVNRVKIKIDNKQYFVFYKLEL